ncbi:MAG: 6-O-methylguanine DNA methyltransferase [Desulfobulbaceae bacterium S3730MH12]|nr:MAG: 6-O-methylguanine DNA methyltransferase [Desulfobulbaceae bacterium S5133MH15]OEU55860.1 MAG: 6-O-methylguanine DNA methyltransferase [Desulfobulbaceae bacterium S3730MH12]OEU81704.1 MAG: 6-O-methylguanine DNA methyltransferase [Desulfobulbaceae bacterium C00003063]
MTPAQFNTDEERWKAVGENNSSADGAFYYAVITTGIYCQPSCKSKLPNRDNVEYFTTCDAAEAAGYRACKRCRPTATSKVQEIKQKIIHACRIIEESDTTIKLDKLAGQVNLSPYHFHRLFKKIVGVTPKQYAGRHQSRRFQKNLKTSPSVTDAIYSAGYGSSGSAYDKKRDQLAMKPKVYRKGADGVTITYELARCFLGWVIVAATDRGVCAIEFGDNSDTLPKQVQARFPNAQLDKADIGFKTLIKEVVDFIESPEDTFEVPLDIQGTAFQQQVWEVLRQIKPGQTMSYSDVAERMGKPKAVRAVASACASNKLAVVIPCHRVVSKTGKTGGYRWGTERKQKLLESEQDRI